MIHREDKNLESLQDNIYFLQKELLMENEIIMSLPEIQTVVLDTISTSQRMLTANKNSTDAPENTSNITLATHHHHHQQQQQQQQQQQHQERQQKQQQQQQQHQQLYNENRQKENHDQSKKLYLGNLSTHCS